MKSPREKEQFAEVSGDLKWWWMKRSFDVSVLRVESALGRSMR